LLAEGASDVARQAATSIFHFTSISNEGGISMKTFRVIAILMVLALLLAACGGTPVAPAPAKEEAAPAEQAAPA
jgi:hypothetical protein